MDLNYLLENWAPCRAALHAHFPQYDFAETPPSLDEFRFALDGLAAIYDLTPTEMIETLEDKMIFAADQTGTRKAA